MRDRNSKGWGTKSGANVMPFRPKSEKAKRAHKKKVRALWEASKILELGDGDIALGKKVSGGGCHLLYAII